MRFSKKLTCSYIKLQTKSKCFPYFAIKCNVFVPKREYTWCTSSINIQLPPQCLEYTRRQLYTSFKKKRQQWARQKKWFTLIVPSLKHKTTQLPVLKPLSREKRLPINSRQRVFGVNGRQRPNAPDPLRHGDANKRHLISQVTAYLNWWTQNTDILVLLNYYPLLMMFT